MRVVRAAYGIEIVLFHQPNVGLDLRERFGVPRLRVMLVFIYATN